MQRTLLVDRKGWCHAIDSTSQPTCMPAAGNDISALPHLTDTARNTGSAPSDTDQHFQTAVQRDLLMSVESCGSQATGTADHGTDTGAFAAAENPPQ